MNPDQDVLLSLKEWTLTRLPKERREALRQRFREPLGWLFQRNLPRLAMIYGTDKWGYHWYAKHYARHFAHWRQESIVVLEIGIGGYANPREGGGSLRMWRRYFPKAKIVGLDLFDKRPHAEKRIHIYRGDQSDESFLKQVVEEVGPPHIVIDDGSHQNAHVIKTFEVLFPLLAEEGVYAVEDTQTAYWPEYGGSSEDLGGARTSVGFLKHLTDGLNFEEYIRPGYVPSYYDRHVTAMHFYHGLVLVQKGRNNEGSTIIRNQQLAVPPAA